MVETRFDFRTTRGPVWLWGRDSGRPVLLYIGGTLAPADFMRHVQGFFPAVDVMRGHMPGNHCPELDEMSLGAIVDAYDQTLDQLGRPAVVVGLSIGGAAALGLRSRHVRHRIAVEPVLGGADLTPLTYLWRTAPDARPFVEGVLGVAEHGPRNLDHGWVLDGLPRAGVDVILGDDTDGAGGLPTLVGHAARQRLAAAGASITVATGVGHNVPLEAALTMNTLTDRALRTLA